MSWMGLSGGWGRAPWVGVGLVGGLGFWGACVGCLGTTVYSHDTVCMQMFLELFFSNGLQEIVTPLHIPLFHGLFLLPLGCSATTSLEPGTPPNSQGRAVLGRNLF